MSIFFIDYTVSVYAKDHTFLHATVGDLKTCSPHDSWMLHWINHWTWNISLLLYFTHWKWLHWTTESWLSPASQPSPPSCSYYAPEGSVSNCTTVYFKCQDPIMWWSLYLSIIKKSPVFWISCWFKPLKLSFFWQIAWNWICCISNVMFSRKFW